MAKNQNSNIAPATQKTEPGAKKDALATALAQIEKQFGKGAIMKLGEKTAMNVQTIPSGCLELDIALGVGGVPRGRIIEIYGPESSGKTTVALHIVAETQKMGGEAAFIDAEHALDPVYAKNLGVNINDLLISQPDTGEQALEIAGRSLTPRRSMSSSSTPWRHSYPSRRLMATWDSRTSACRHV